MRNFFAWIMLILIFGCSDSNDTAETPINKGQNFSKIIVDGVQREFYFHVPQTFSSTDKVPVVIMCHGSGGDGLKMYNNSGWKEVGETENIITVFPSSGEYCVYEEGKKIKQAKWNAAGSFSFCENEKPLNDRKFMKEMIAWFDKKLGVDLKRIHIVGFSNGASFAADAGLAMSDVFASSISCAGIAIKDTTYQVSSPISTIVQMGQNDDRFSSTPLEMDLKKLIENGPGVQNSINTYINSLQLKPQPVYGGNVDQMLTAEYSSVSIEGKHFFRFLLVKGLGHVYPNGSGHPMKAAEIHWSMIRDIVK